MLFQRYQKFKISPKKVFKRTETKISISPIPNTYKIALISLFGLIIIGILVKSENKLGVLALIGVAIIFLFLIIVNIYNKIKAWGFKRFLWYETGIPSLLLLLHLLTGGRFPSGDIVSRVRLKENNKIFGYTISNKGIFLRENKEFIPWSDLDFFYETCDENRRGKKIIIERKNKNRLPIELKVPFNDSKHSKILLNFLSKYLKSLSGI